MTSELVARATRLELLKLCNIDICPIDSSYYFYRVNLAANATFLALFSASLLGFIATYGFTRRGLAFSVAMVRYSVSSLGLCLILTLTSLGNWSSSRTYWIYWSD